MKTIIKLSLAVSATLFFVTGCAHNEAMEHKAAHNPHEVHWGYDGENGPNHWGELKEEFTMCSHGKMQTPINIIPTTDTNIAPLEFAYSADATNVINNGHTVQVNIANGSSVTIDGKVFDLLQFHFHTPSENNIKGDSYPLEAHFVHKAKDGQLAVVAVMFQEGAENQVLAKIWNKFPLKVNEKEAIALSNADIQALMPANKDYYKFMGSLTTPPCSENVKWNVYKTSVSISKEQVKQFFDTFGHPNNRPIQAANNRTIEE